MLALGGRVEFQRCWRVVVEPKDGRPGSGLAVSRCEEGHSPCRLHLSLPPPCRSLGDLDFKEPRRFVESEPEVHRLVLGPGDSYVVLASDGLWDVMSDEDAIECANQVFKVGGNDGGGQGAD